MPRGGVRDEEFHTAVCELLSDWGSTVAAPEVESVRIVSPGSDALTLGIRDFLDRMGLPNRTYHPDTEEGREVLAAAGADPTFPLVRAMDSFVFSPRTVRDVAVRVYGSPVDIDVDTVVDVAIVGAGPRAWPRRCTRPPRGSRPSSSRPRRWAGRRAPRR